MTLRVVITGDRYQKDRNPVLIVLEGLYRLSKGNMEIIEGGARGVDTIARQWCKKRKVKCHTENARWAELGNRAGMVRNAKMLDDYDPHLVIGIHSFISKSKGTRGCLDMARARGIKYYLFG